MTDLPMVAKASLVILSDSEGSALQRCHERQTADSSLALRMTDLPMVAKASLVILSDSEGSAFAALPRETNSRFFAGAQNDRFTYGRKSVPCHPERQRRICFAALPRETSS